MQRNPVDIQMTETFQNALANRKVGPNMYATRPPTKEEVERLAAYDLAMKECAIMPKGNGGKKVN